MHVCFVETPLHAPLYVQKEQLTYIGKYFHHFLSGSTVEVRGMQVLKDL